MKLSIVATLYQSAPYLNEFYERATAAARQIVEEDYEIVLVNDGSPDNSVDLAIALAEVDAHVVVVDLSRNFGHHKAMLAGLAQSRGDRIFLIDSDLEEEPEWLADFATTMAAEAVDVVYGVQEVRKGNWFERWSGELYYTVFNYLANIDHPRNIVTARLMSRRYVDALLQFREREMVISCLWVITGFRQCARPVKKHMASVSTYSLAKKIEHATNSITSFSEVPLRLIFYVGLIIFAGALLYTGYLVFHKLVLATPMDGWTSVMVSIWLLGGMIISFVGLIGIYLSKIFSEAKQRPSVITVLREASRCPSLSHRIRRTHLPGQLSTTRLPQA
jgi:putative glycosyltransferase